MQKNNRSALTLMAAMFLFGTIGPFVRRIGVSSGELALYRGIPAALMIGAFLVLTKQRLDLRSAKKDLLLLMISGGAMGFNWILLFEAYKYTTVSVATLSYYFAPILVTAACPLLFKEKLTKKQVLCFVMSTIGLIMITGLGDAGKGSKDIIGILFSLGAAVLYAGVVLLNKFIKNIAGIHRTFLQFLAAIVVLIPYVTTTSGVTLSGLDSTGWICLLIVGIVHTGVTYCMYFSALGDLPGQKAALLSYIDPLVAVVVSVTVLGEEMQPLQLLGGGLILVFTLLNELPDRKRK